MKLSLNWLNQYVDLKNIDINCIVDAIEKCICPVISYKKTNTGDTVIEIRNRLRGDLLGHYGIARELSAIFNLNLKELSISKIENAISMERNENDGSWNTIRVECNDSITVPDSVMVLLASCEANKSKCPGELLCEYIMLELGVPMKCITEETGKISFISSVGDPTKPSLNGAVNERSKRYIYSQYVNFAIERLIYLLNTDCTVYSLNAPEIEPEKEYLITKNDVAELYGSEEPWARSEEIFKALGLLKYKKSPSELALHIPFWRNPIDLNHKVSFIRELIRIYSYTYNESNVAENILPKCELMLPRDRLRLEMEKLSINEVYFKAFTENDGKIELRKCLYKGMNGKIDGDLSYEIGHIYGNNEEEHICVAIKKSLFDSMINNIINGIENALSICLALQESSIYCKNKKIGEALPLCDYIYVELNITEYLGIYL